MHTYNLNGSQIITEEWDGNLLVYLYDADGSPMGMRYRTESYGQYVYDTFWFDKNLQGDIVAVYDAKGTKLISYKYDAWGNFATDYHNGCTASSPANYNPFRYRGYYYDVELGMYYLQSRYYDPVIGRFINADSYLSTGQGPLGANMFSYCNGNPINYCDPSGEIAVIDDLAIAGIALIACAVAGFILITFPTVVDTTNEITTNISLSNSFQMSKGGRQNQGKTWLRDWTDEEIDDALRKKDLPKKERQDLVTEQKNRGTRNKQKRKGYHYSMSAKSYEILFESIQIFLLQEVVEVLKIVLRW